jgi:hypothetical protein
VVLLHQALARGCANVDTKEVYFAANFLPHPFHDGVAFHAANSVIGVNVEKGRPAVANSVYDFISDYHFRATGPLPKPESDYYGQSRENNK